MLGACACCAAAWLGCVDGEAEEVGGFFGVAGAARVVPAGGFCAAVFAASTSASVVDAVAEVVGFG